MRSDELWAVRHNCIEQRGNFLTQSSDVCLLARSWSQVLAQSLYLCIQVRGGITSRLRRPQVLQPRSLLECAIARRVCTSNGIVPTPVIC